MKNELKMEPKGLPEFPGKSRKSHPSRPRRSQETPGIPKGPPRHPTAAKTASNDPKKSPKGPPNDPQKTPRDAISIHKGLQKAPKKAFKRHPKGTKTQNRKSMQPSSPQRLHRRNSQTTLRRKRSRPCGMRGALESAATPKGLERVR